MSYPSEYQKIVRELTRPRLTLAARIARWVRQLMERGR